ncbi:MAG TPA: hypothetical protein VHZ55_21680 [Bryobacteraceae bacterium]|nr:hypothetical protein [Bryobacteraceae bacterium]
MWALLAVSALTASAQDWGPPAGSQPDYSLIYTGKLFGYYRYPDIQNSSDRGCPDLAHLPLSPQVALFRNTLAAMGSVNRELVAMGDNFAPDLLARDMRNDTPATPRFGSLLNKDLWAAAQNEVPSDNVACFLRLMGFDAVVPGQEDFYYGPERLRQLARFLASPSAAGPYRPVQMLASNLVIRSAVRNQEARLPNSELPLLVQQALDGNSPVRFDIPSAVMPWLRDIGVSGQATHLRVFDCQAEPGNPKSFTLPGQQENRCTELSPASPRPLRFAFEPPPHPSANFLPQYYRLDPGSNHALCATYLDGGPGQVHCQLFSVQYPFFQYNPAPSGQAPAPYFIPPDAKGAAIFGVLDPTLVSYIGQLNDVWINRNKQFDTSAQIIDPLEAMRQVLALCAADSNCKDRRKVLLAQMPYYRAAELAAKLKVFDIVVAQPDQEHATGPQTMSQLDATPGTPFLLNPGVAFDGSRQEFLSANLRRADFYSHESSRYLANRVQDVRLKVPEGLPCPTCALDREVAAAVAQPVSPKKANSYENLALKTMQEFCGADIALLQHRDVFAGFDKAVRLWPASLNPSPQQLLDEALWKGDFAFCVPVKGSTLKTVLLESAAFDQQDQDNLSIEVEKGRGLSTLGIQNDPYSGQPLIRGQVIEDSKLYGVAMTDYLAFGNTGYPELSSEAIQPVVRIVSLKGLNRLTGLVCEHLSNQFTNGSCQDDEIPAADYFAAIEQHPFDTSRGLTAWIDFRRWITHPLQTQPNVTTFAAKKTAIPENVVERRGLWWFTLQNVSLGYNLNFIGGSDRTVPGNFVGNNSFSQLSTPESSNLDLWARVRGGYSFPRFLDFYSSAEVRYSRLAVRNSINNGNFGDYQTTLNNNLLRAEAGFTTKPITSRVPVRILVSEDLLTQPTPPFQQFVAPVACGLLPCPNGSSRLATFDLAKNYLVVTRVGARIQNDQSWFEAGREYGANIDTPSSFSILDASSPSPFPCPVSATSFISQCVALDPFFTTQSKIVPELRNQRVTGWFANFHTVVPLWKSKLQLVADSYGELFDRLHDDTTYNTRFYEDLTLSLRVPVWGNLSFAPQVETFFFQNKIVPNEPAALNHYVFVTTSVKLEYAFDWHRGVGLLRALRFPNGVSTNTSTTVPRP